MTYLLRACLILRVSQSMFPIRFEWARISKILFSVVVSLLLVKCLQFLLPSLSVWILPFLHVTNVLLFLLILRFPEEEEIGRKHLFFKDVGMYFGDIIK